jgi:Na+/phosphate symporter
MKAPCRQLRSLVIALTVLLTCGALLTAQSAEDENPQLSQLLENVNDEVFHLANDVTDTQMLIRSDADWINHVLILAKVKGHVDNLALITEELRKTQKFGSALHEEAVERMPPLVKQLSANTTAAINYLNQNKSRPVSEAYTKYLEKTRRQHISSLPSFHPRSTTKKYDGDRKAQKQACAES